jgi:hypothetical protein
MCVADHDDTVVDAHRASGGANNRERIRHGANVQVPNASQL